MGIILHREFLTGGEMHKLTELLWNKWRSGEYCQNDFDKIITDYLSQRAEWLKLNLYKQMSHPIEKLLAIAFEIEPKEEKKNCLCSCGRFYLVNKDVRIFDGLVHRKNNPCYVLSRPEPKEEKIEIPEKLLMQIVYSDATISNTINKLIDAVTRLSKIVGKGENGLCSK